MPQLAISVCNFPLFPISGNQICFSTFYHQSYWYHLWFLLPWNIHWNKKNMSVGPFAECSITLMIFSEACGTARQGVTCGRKRVNNLQKRNVPHQGWALPLDISVLSRRFDFNSLTLNTWLLSETLWILFQSFIGQSISISCDDRNTPTSVMTIWIHRHQLWQCNTWASVVEIFDNWL